MSDENPEDPKGKILSLADKRKKKADQVRKTYLPLEQRVSEMEADMIRVIDSVTELDQALANQARTVRLIVRVLSTIVARIPEPEPAPEAGTEPKKD